MVYRVYVEKKNGFDHEASALYRELKSFLGIEALEGVRDRWLRLVNGEDASVTENR